MGAAIPRALVSLRAPLAVIPPPTSTARALPPAQMPPSEVEDLRAEIEHVLRRLIAARRDDADDIIQDAWVEIIRRWRAGWSIGAIRATVHATARNARFNFYRRRARKDRGRKPADLDAVGVPPAPARPEFTLATAVAPLPEPLRVVVIEVWANGATRGEAARVLNTTPRRIDGLLGRARRALRPALAAHAD